MRLRVRELRDAMPAAPGKRKPGWSQARLAEAAGISQSAVSQVETGDLNVTMATLDKLATALGVEVTDLFVMDDPVPPAGELLSRWRRLSPEHQAAVVQMAEGLLKASRSGA